MKIGSFRFVPRCPFGGVTPILSLYAVYLCLSEEREVRKRYNKYVRVPNFGQNPEGVQQQLEVIRKTYSNFKLDFATSHKMWCDEM